MPDMDDSTFDEDLIAATFTLAAELGWAKTSVVAAARAAGLPLDRARARFPGKSAVLLKFGRMADQAAIAHGDEDGPSRDRLFDATMRRIDVLQAHRAGVLALREYLPARPMLTMMLGAATLTSMAWLLESAGISAQGGIGFLRVQGMNAIWLYTVRAWTADDSTDLAATMRALDKALDQAIRAEGWLGRGQTEAPPPFPEPPLPEPPADAETSTETSVADTAAFDFAASEADLIVDTDDKLPRTGPATAASPRESPPV